MSKNFPKPPRIIASDFFVSYVSYVSCLKFSGNKPAPPLK
jgi:hypothetical protein